MHVIEQLRCCPEPIIQYLSLIRFSDPDEIPSADSKLEEEVRHSPLVNSLLSERNSNGEIPHHPYNKWRGAHWVLACLADLEYPIGDDSLRPLFEQVYTWLFSPRNLQQIKEIEGRFRRCASLEGNALFSSLALGFIDDRTHSLAERLIKMQWPDGGWNCDIRPEANHSSFMESLIPLRALARYARLTQDTRFLLPVQSAIEFFLRHQLFQKEQDGRVISPDFLSLHYPCYWHYDILFALKVMVETGFISDPRCQAALDILESKRSPDGGFAMGGKYFSISETAKTGRSLVNWKAYTLPGQSLANAFVTLDALYVLKRAGRNIN